ncbi:hypothetical protein C0J52_15170 [Blattella germanica]|nr:hypothetical protein C0J52_15170 [Blattella germanica]
MVISANTASVTHSKHHSESLVYSIPIPGTHKRGLSKTPVTLTFSYAEPTLSSRDRKDSEFFSWPSFMVTLEPNPPRREVYCKTLPLHGKHLLQLIKNRPKQATVNFLQSLTSCLLHPRTFLPLASNGQNWEFLIRRHTNNNSLLRIPKILLEVTVTSHNKASPTASTSLYFVRFQLVNNFKAISQRFILRNVLGYHDLEIKVFEKVLQNQGDLENLSDEELLEQQLFGEPALPPQSCAPLFLVMYQGRGGLGGPASSEPGWSESNESGVALRDLVPTEEKLLKVLKILTFAKKQVNWKNEHGTISTEQKRLIEYFTEDTPTAFD